MSNPHATIGDVSLHFMAVPEPKAVKDRVHLDVTTDGPRDVDGAGRLHYGSVTAPFVFTEQDLSGRASIADVEVRCERAEWAVRCHLGYVPRDSDRHDVDLLCTRFAIERPEGYR